MYVSEDVLRQDCQAVCGIFVSVFTDQMSSVTLSLSSLLILNPTFALQGAQEMFNALPCEFVEPHELKEVSQSGGIL